MHRSGIRASAIDPFLNDPGWMILDGGLATELEARGWALEDELWSARLLLERPDAIRQVHLDYLSAGADCVVTASYQATIEGFRRRGLSAASSAELLASSVDLARSARELFWSRPENRSGRRRPLVAASVGPYGAYLADGSEFRGDYELQVDELEDFHRRRWQILVDAGPDLLACETLPSWVEARALRRLLEASSDQVAWFSFSCRDGWRISDGSPIEEVAKDLDDCGQIIAFGVNCTRPRFIAELITAIRRGTSKPVIVYPNSGESWDAASKSWRPGAPSEPSLSSIGRNWVARGARLIGGCCRVGPAEVASLRRSLLA